MATGCSSSSSQARRKADFAGFKKYGVRRDFGLDSATKVSPPRHGRVLLRSPEAFRVDQLPVGIRGRLDERSRAMGRQRHRVRMIGEAEVDQDAGCRGKVVERSEVIL